MALTGLMGLRPSEELCRDVIMGKTWIITSLGDNAWADCLKTQKQKSTAYVETFQDSEGSL